MKKIFYTIIAVLAGLCTVSCDDLLDAVPKDRMTPDSFFKNKTELQAFAMNLYTMLPGTGLYQDFSDLYEKDVLSEEIQGIRTIASSASDGGWSWGGLRNVNTLIEYLPHCPDASVRTYYEALARFFRAYYYFDKVKRFGDVPWYDKPVGSTDNEQLNRPRDSREFIMGKMIEDIDFAIANLPSTKSAYEITRWTAMALKSRFTLFEGTFRKYHTEFDYGTGSHDAKWYLDLCAETSLALMTGGGYALYTSGGPDVCYRRLFSTMNATDLTTEVILARDYNLAYGVYHNSNIVIESSSNGTPGMTKKAVASYLCTDGTRFTDKAGWQTMDFAQETVGRDPRLAQSIKTPGYKRIGQDLPNAPSLKSSVTGYQPTKYLTTVDQDVWNGSDIDLIIFRLGEILLNYAEAKAEAGTLTQSDLDISVNLLRDRVGMPHLDMAVANGNPDAFLTNAEWGGYQNVSGANKGVILEIRRERAVELCQEGHRYYDIIRWKEGKIFEKQFYGMYFPGAGEYDLDGDGTLDVMLYTADQKNPDGSAPKTNAKLSFLIGDVDGAELILSEGTKGFINKHKNVTCTWNEDRDYLYPIPTDERSLTHGALVQNPGWNDGLNF